MVVKSGVRLPPNSFTPLVLNQIRGLYRRFAAVFYNYASMGRSDYGTHLSPDKCRSRKSSGTMYEKGSRPPAQCSFGSALSDPLVM